MVAQRRLSHLQREIAQQWGVRLDGVPLIIVVREVKQLKNEVAPLSAYSLEG